MVAIARRKVLTGLGSAAVAWPLCAHAQEARPPVVGVVSGVSFEGPYAAPIAAIRKGLQERGFVEGRDVRLELRSANGRYDRLSELAAELARGGAAVIVAIGVSSELAAKAAASSVPIVLAMGSDAVDLAVLSGADRADADTTGAAAASASRRLELLLELRRAPLVGYLDNSRMAGSFEANVASVTATARKSGRDLVAFDVGTERAIESAFTTMALQRVRAVVVGADPFLTSRQEQIVEFAGQIGLPTIYATRGAVVAGGLIGYGVVTDDLYRIAGIYAGEILNGRMPTELPVKLPTRFELVINKRTADALRIDLPQRLLIRADEIIG
jgi:putative ABC transport system substrate-binding protein